MFDAYHAGSKQISNKSRRLCGTTMYGVQNTPDFTLVYGDGPADRMHVRYRSKIGCKKALDLGSKKNRKAQAFSFTGKNEKGQSRVIEALSYENFSASTGVPFPTRRQP